MGVGRAALSTPGQPGRGIPNDRPAPPRAAGDKRGAVAHRSYHREAMPIYEFRCERCQARFEALEPVGTDSVACRECGSPGATRVLSAQAAPMRLVKPPGEARKQEAKNARLHARTKQAFSERRRRAREARGGGPAGGGGA